MNTPHDSTFVLFLPIVCLDHEQPPSIYNSRLPGYPPRCRNFVTDDTLSARQREVDDLAYLPPGGAVARSELQAARAAGIPGDDTPTACGLHVPEEYRPNRHVSE